MRGNNSVRCPVCDSDWIKVKTRFGQTYIKCMNCDYKFELPEELRYERR